MVKIRPSVSVWGNTKVAPALLWGPLIRAMSQQRPKKLSASFRSSSGIGLWLSKNRLSVRHGSFFQVDEHWSVVSLPGFPYRTTPYSVYSPETYEGHWKQLTVRTTRTKEAMAIVFFHPQVRDGLEGLPDYQITHCFSLNFCSVLEIRWRGSECVKGLHEEALHRGRGDRERSDIAVLCQRGSTVRADDQSSVYQHVNETLSGCFWLYNTCTWNPYPHLTISSVTIFSHTRNVSFVWYIFISFFNMTLPWSFYIKKLSSCILTVLLTTVTLQYFHTLFLYPNFCCRTLTPVTLPVVFILRACVAHCLQWKTVLFCCLVYIIVYFL